MTVIGVFWPELPGYLSVGLEELVRRGHDVRAFVCATRGSDARERATAAGIPVIDVREAGWSGRGLDAIETALICGWHVPEFRTARTLLRAGCARILYFDTQWTGSIRQQLKRRVAAYQLPRQYDQVFVPGFPQAEFARRIGFAEDRIHWGSLTFDADAFLGVEPLSGENLPGRRRFLFAGRLAGEKGLGNLASAYRRYREDSRDPWGLMVAGEGEDSITTLLSSMPGVEVLGHLPSNRLAECMGKAACLVLPSIYEPYGVVLLEAAGAGLPIITSSRAGAVGSVIEPELSGWLTDPNDDQMLARRLIMVSDLGGERLEGIGALARSRAMSFTPQRWADALTLASNASATESGRGAE